ncbi:cytochrome P450 [Streptomyces sp. NPDC002845]
MDWHGTPAWTVSRFEDIRALLSDPRISTETTNDHHLPQSFPKMDDPEHARLRLMLTKDFTVKRVQAMRPHIQEMVDRILDEMISKGQPADLVTAYALPIPSLVISLLLGVPYADHAFFQEHSGILLNASVTEEERQAASGALYNYLVELVARKEREPGDDRLSRLIVERVATGEISRETAAMNGNVLLIAGHETTSNMIALSTITLLQNPEALARIRDTDNPAVIAKAVEELLRYLTIAQDQIVRVALEDLTIGGQLIRAGADRHQPARGQPGQGVLHRSRPLRHRPQRPQRPRASRLRLRHSPVPRTVPGTHRTGNRAAHAAAPAAGTPAGGTDRAAQIPAGDGHLRRPRTAGRVVTPR